MWKVSIVVSFQGIEVHSNLHLVINLSKSIMFSQREDKEDHDQEDQDEDSQDDDKILQGNYNNYNKITGFKFSENLVTCSNSSRVWAALQTPSLGGLRAKPSKILAKMLSK